MHTGTKGQFEHRSLLLVQPVPLMPQLMAVRGEDAWKVEVCPNLLQAFVRLGQRPFEALLVHEDSLPQTCNPLEEIRRLYPDVIVVAIASSRERLDGADECLDQPCDPYQVVRALDRAYKEQRQRRRLKELQRENEQLTSKLWQQNNQLARLARGSARLSKVASEPRALFKTALDVLSDASGAQRASLMLLSRDNHEEELRVVEGRGLPDEAVARTRLKVGEAVAGWVAKHGLPLLKKPDRLSRDRKGEATSYKSNAFLSLPLKVADEVLGVVNLTERVGDRVFSEAEVSVLSKLAEQVALSIRHCRMLEEAKKLSVIDDLTSLYNRRYFTDAIKREISRAQRADRRLSLAMLDIDHFKAYNDTLGHRAGDELLRQFARLLRENLRSTDILCRYGGEEFSLILPETGKGGSPPPQSGVHFIDRLRAAVAEFPFDAQYVQTGVRLTVSGGVAVFPDDGSNPEELIAVADKMLYRAKSAGRNCTCSTCLLSGAVAQ